MIFNINKKTQKIITATSIIIWTVVGVWFLSMPYVAVKSWFLTTMWYLFVFWALILLINLYFGEIILRTKEDHQLVWYAEKYLWTKGKNIMFVLMAFAILSALLAYMIGVWESLSYIIFWNLEYTTILWALFGFLMSILLRRWVSSLRKYERLGVLLLILMLILIFIFFTKDINYANLTIFNKWYLFLPLWVVLFSLIEFFSLPSVVKVLKKDESLTKKVIIIWSIITILIYALFTFLVVWISWEGTPQVSTLALWTPFIIIWMITMFTSYLALWTSLEWSFIQDYKNKKKTARFRSAILPIAIFLFLEMFDFFSFINIITIWWIIAWWLIVILVLIIHRKAHTQWNRIPEYEVFLSKSLAILISSLFIIWMIFEIVNFFLK